MKHVLIAGATGYLGRHLVREFRAHGWYVLALVRSESRARKAGLEADAMIEGEATRPADLRGIMEGVDLVVSALGITRQKDGLTYRDVDFQANANLLAEAERAGVGRFAYVHVLGAEKMRNVALVRARQDFVDLLQASPVASTIVRPGGYFSDMGDFLDMAAGGRVWLFGDGEKRLNPIHGADLAAAMREAIKAGRDDLTTGGPRIYTQNELAELAFACLDKPARITRLPNWVLGLTIWLLTNFTRQNFHGPIHFFLTAMRFDMVGEAHGKHDLATHFCALAKARQEKPGV